MNPIPCAQITLNDGNKMPQFGLGVYQSKGQECVDAVKWALEAGYRHIDTAQLYGNEAEVAKGIKESGVPREEIFITTKVWNSHQGYEKTIEAFEGSLKKLQTTYVDLYLIHAPQEGTRKDTWRALEDLKKSGKAKSIGISNYGAHHIQEMDSYATIPPAVNQLELHPYFQRKDIVDECNKRNIVVEAWGSVTRGQHFGEAALKSLSAKYGKTQAQVLLRWALQKSYVIIPKSVHKERIIENAQIFDFELSAEDVTAIEGWDASKNVGWNPATWN